MNLFPILHFRRKNRAVKKAHPVWVFFFVQSKYHSRIYTSSYGYGFAQLDISKIRYVGVSLFFPRILNLSVHHRAGIQLAL